MSLTWINQGGATYVDGFLLAPANAGLSVRALVESALTPPFSFGAIFTPVLSQVGTQSCGLVMRESSSGKMVTFQVDVTATVSNITVVKLNSPTSVAAAYTSSIWPLARMAVFRVTDDGANRVCQWSVDQTNWITFHSVSRTDFLTADQIGFFANTQTTLAPAGILVQPFMASP